MSLALYRKYRPATFGELKGQEHVAEPLQQALRNGRINHAYLFSGPRGCGKTSSARILARSLNCVEGPTPDPCGVCESCVALGPGGAGHLDVIEIDAASHGGVDDARDLRERAFFAPVSSRFKVYIIDEAHMVTREGFNALLKLVEEPPPHLKFVFATTEPEKVIGTIRSRTHHYPFRLIPPKTLQELLEEILQAEKVPYEETALPLVVRAGAGSARDSLSILDQLLAGSDEAGITYTRAVSLLGYTDAALLDVVVDAFAARNGAAVFAAIDQVVESGQDPRRFTADLLGRFRDLVIMANVPDATKSGLIDGPADELERMTAQAAALGPADLTRAADLLHAGLTEMRGATSPRLLLELICARILLPGAYNDEAALLARLDRLERSGPPAQVATAQVATAQVATAQVAAPRVEASPPPRAVEPRPAIPEPAPHVPEPAPRAPEPARARPAARQESRPAPSRPAANDGWGAPVESPAPAAPAAAPPSSGGVDVNVVRQRWPQILDAVQQKSRVAWMTIMEGVTPAAVDGNLLTIAFANDGKRKNFTMGRREGVLAEVLREQLGVDWRIDAVLGGAVQPSARPASAPPPPTWEQPRQAPERRPAPAPAPAAAAAPVRPSAPQPSVPQPSEPLPPPPEAPMDEGDDEEVGAPPASEAVSGMALIQRELGGQVIREIDNS
ncbi:DNA polymerase III subunit gamma and tau [Actinocorallia aurantiaca]|uniref:DNA polymerase III subunit gamma/tau n=1 Tax=Actinocorallia aurantiaca TaxID=46204 RepID=A0ABN3TUB9_9ACTN